MSVTREDSHSSQKRAWVGHRASHVSSGCASANVGHQAFAIDMCGAPTCWVPSRRD